MEAFMGTIMIWPNSRPPVNWFLCDGSILEISQYTAFHSIIGNAFGGNGLTTFALPDLRNSVPIHSQSNMGMITNVTGVNGVNTTLTQNNTITFRLLNN